MNPCCAILSLVAQRFRALQPTDLCPPATGWVRADNASVRQKAPDSPNRPSASTVRAAGQSTPEHHCLGTQGVHPPSGTLPSPPVAPGPGQRLTTSPTGGNNPQRKHRLPVGNVSANRPLPVPRAAETVGDLRPFGDGRLGGQTKMPPQARPGGAGRPRPAPRQSS